MIAAICHVLLERPTSQQTHKLAKERSFRLIRLPHVSIQFYAGCHVAPRGRTCLQRGVIRDMKLSEMFADHEELTFEERRAEVVGIVRSATDFTGADRGLRRIFLAMSSASDEMTFDAAFDELMECLNETTLRYLQTT